MRGNIGTIVGVYSGFLHRDHQKDPVPLSLRQANSIEVNVFAPVVVGMEPHVAPSLKRRAIFVTFGLPRLLEGV